MFSPPSLSHACNVATQGFAFPQSFTYIAVDLVTSRRACFVSPYLPQVILFRSYFGQYTRTRFSPRRSLRKFEARTLQLTGIGYASLTSRKLIAETSHVHTEADGPFGTVHAAPGPDPSALRAHSARRAPNEEWELHQVGFHHHSSASVRYFGP